MNIGKFIAASLQMMIAVKFNSIYLIIHMHIAVCNVCSATAHKRLTNASIQIRYIIIILIYGRWCIMSLNWIDRFMAASMHLCFHWWNNNRLFYGHFICLCVWAVWYAYICHTPHIPWCHDKWNSSSIRSDRERVQMLISSIHIPVFYLITRNDCHLSDC